MIFPAINLHLLGIFHGYVSHKQMVIHYIMGKFMVSNG